MNDDAISSYTSSPECGSRSPSFTRLESYTEEESIIQPGILVYNMPDPLEGELKKGKLVAQGGYGDVYCGSWTPPSADPIPVAIKHIRMARLDPEAEDEVDHYERFARILALRFLGLAQRIKREVVVWQAAKHENILEFYGFNIDNGDYLLVSSWCANGNLRQYTKRHPELTRMGKIKLLHDAAQGLAHLHSLDRPIIHGDVKPENIMITNVIKAVLCDFGVSRVIAGLGMHTGLTSMGQCSGTVGYQARELQDEDSQPTVMCDVFAFGGVILATMSGNGPFYKKIRKGPGGVAATTLAIHRRQTPTPSDHPGLPESDKLWDLLKACWNSEPRQRRRIAAVRDSLWEEIFGSIPTINVQHPTAPNTPIRRPRRLSVCITPPLAGDTLSPRAPTTPYDMPDPLDGIVTKIRRIGGGAYVDVYQGVWTLPGKDPIPVAIKRIREAHLDDEDDPQAKQARFERRIRRETAIWQMTSHKNILPFHGYQIVDGEPMLVSPWCKNGNLTSYLTKHPDMSDADKLKLLRDAACGLAYLHSLEPPIIHVRIKPNAVIITDDVVGSLCEFGLSRVMTSRGMHTGLTTAVQGTGTAGYQAKELYDENSRPTAMSDVYAFGGLILAAMSGKPPFYKKTIAAAIIISISCDDTAMPVDHPELPEGDRLWDLLRRSWDPVPEQRPSMAQIVEELESEIQKRSTSTTS
ncbi:hypothetical protein FRC04_005251 [Tulasnella sp. 424]|nr:hypothetical protein FRC04_005251 [Tulasnella sp. 424]